MEYNGSLSPITPNVTDTISDSKYLANDYGTIKYFKEPDTPLNTDIIDIVLLGEVVPIVEFSDNYIPPEDAVFRYPENNIQVTLVTAGCRVEPSLNEVEIGPTLRPTLHIPYIESNYGLHALEGYVIKKRNKRPKIRTGCITCKRRKHNGNGKCMNSCVQYNVKLNPDIVVNAKPNKVYKVKRFRKANIQVPGGLREDLQDIKDILEKTIRYEKTFCNPNTRITTPVAISMINYKFLLTSVYNVKLDRLNEILEKYRDSQTSKPITITPTTPNDLIRKPYIYTIRYDVSNVIIVVSFSVPIEDKPDKKIIVRISYKGKINIQGGMSDRRPTIAIYNFILDLFRRNQDVFINIPMTDEEYFQKTGKVREAVEYISDEEIENMEQMEEGNYEEIYDHP